MIYLPMPSKEEATARAQQEAQVRADRRAKSTGAGGGPLLIESQGADVLLVLRDEDWQLLTTEEMVRAKRQPPEWLIHKRLLLGERI